MRKANCERAPANLKQLTMDRLKAIMESSYDGPDRGYLAAMLTKMQEGQISAGLLLHIHSKAFKTHIPNKKSAGGSGSFQSRSGGSDFGRSFDDAEREMMQERSSVSSQKGPLKDAIVELLAILSNGQSNPIYTKALNEFHYKLEHNSNMGQNEFDKIYASVWKIGEKLGKKAPPKKEKPAPAQKRATEGATEKKERLKAECKQWMHQWERLAENERSRLSTFERWMQGGMMDPSDWSELEGLLERLNRNYTGAPGKAAQATGYVPAADVMALKQRMADLYPNLPWGGESRDVLSRYYNGAMRDETRVPAEVFNKAKADVDRFARQPR